MADDDIENKGVEGSQVRRREVEEASAIADRAKGYANIRAPGSPPTLDDVKRARADHNYAFGQPLTK